ncbi:MAG: flagellar protein FlaG [Helicobacteraceae bacterium]|nr:flagellar protein FlaG [Helicobacteraceae bacterium]
MDATIQSLGSSSQYSITQASNYDNVLKQNIHTTQFRVEDGKLSNLSDDEKVKLEQQLLDLVKDLNKEMESINTDLMFDYEDSISSLVLTIKQKESGEIIRQIPTDEAMELMKKMRDIISIVLDTQG